MASTPSFTNTPRLASVSISTANTNRDGTGSITLLIAGVASGTRVEEVVVKATGPTTAGMVRLFTTTDGGTTWRLYDEVQVDAVTPSGTTESYRQRWGFVNMVLGSASDALGVATNNAEAFVVTAHGGDLD